MLKNNYINKCILILLYLAPINSFAQNIQWQKCYGGTGDEIVSQLIQTSDDGFLIVGGSSSNDFDAIQNHGGYDGLVIKTDSSGNIVWNKCFGGSQDDQIFCVVQTNDGGFLLGGGAKSNDGDLTSNIGGYDVWIVKISDSGSIEWQKTYGGTQSDAAYSVIIDNFGNYILLCRTFSNDSNVTGNHGNGDLWVIKIDSAGHLIQQKCLGGSNSDYAFSMTSIANNYYILATTFSYDGDIPLNHGLDDLWLVVIDNNLNIIRSRCYGGTLDDFGYGINSMNNETLEIVGHTYSNDGDIYGIADTVMGNYLWLELDTLGNIIHSINYGGASSDEGRNISPKNNGNFIISGASASMNGQVSGSHGGSDFWILETDPTGNILQENCFGGFGSDYPYDLKLTNDGGLVVAGHTSDNSGNVSGFYGGFTDFWVLKLSDISNSTETTYSNKLEIFPNPAVETITIQECKLNTSIKLYNLEGRLLVQTIANNNKIEIPLHSLDPGIYILSQDDFLFSKVIKLAH